MNRLVSVIGPAPSEYSWEDWLGRLRVERERVQKELALFRAGSFTQGKGKTLTVKKVGKKKREAEDAKREVLLAQLELIGMTEEEYNEKVKEQKENE